VHHEATAQAARAPAPTLAILLWPTSGLPLSGLACYE
jgi:hypothetical protein